MTAERGSVAPTPSKSLLNSHPVIVFSLLRLALFLVAVAVLYAVGFRELVLFAGAILLSGLASLPLLARQRAAVAANVAERSRRVRERMDAATRSDDIDE